MCIRDGVTPYRTHVTLTGARVNIVLNCEHNVRLNAGGVQLFLTVEGELGPGVQPHAGWDLAATGAWGRRGGDSRPSVRVSTTAGVGRDLVLQNG